ncbi:MAG: zinc ABC transporter substrate-binding protein [Thermodesulfobacteriota bacterium]|nr:zinc ABC transporter substrate-binding protein [Thermodesulfobacteriota bacterium]
MNFIRLPIFASAMVCLLALAAWGSQPLPVFVSIAPQKYFVERIGGDHVSVSVMVAPGASPATYEPRPGQMRALSAAVLYFAIGVPFEQVWLPRIAAANPAMKIVHTDRGIEKRAMTRHAHDDGHAEAAVSHGGADPHIWLSPSLVNLQAATIANALKEADPAHADDYQARADAFFAELETLDKELRALFAGAAGARFLVFHPSWGYFADAYGLVQVPMEVEGKEPKPGQMRYLIEHAGKNRISVILVAPQFSSRSAKVLAEEIGGTVAVADPLAENWPDNLRAVARTIRGALNR